MSLCQRI